VAFCSNGFIDLLKQDSVHFTKATEIAQQRVIFKGMIGDATVELTVFCPASESAEEGFVTSEFYVSKITTRMISLSEASWWEVSYNAIQV
ncbi:MAG: hypothetical protein K2N29_00310, partial [Ruminiclostridium sp.]|nr:hypothetical protein [Ruminiclostridium sp.]